MRTVFAMVLAAALAAQPTAAGQAAFSNAAFFQQLSRTRISVLSRQKKTRLADRPSDRAHAWVLERLRGSGVPENYIRAAFEDPAVKILPEVVRRWNPPDRPEVPGERRTYEQYRRIFITPGRLNKGKSFYLENKALIHEVAAHYGVDPFLLVSFPGVETYFGNYTGKYTVFNALYTTIHKVPRRSAWAVRELAEYLKFCHRDGVETQAVRGSYAGAFGYGQFIPSSYNHYAVDYDGDGVRRWNDWPDVLASIANYLVKNGYQPGDTDFSRGSSIWRAIYAYNHYDFYVRVIIDFRKEVMKKLNLPSA